MVAVLAAASALPVMLAEEGARAASVAGLRAELSFAVDGLSALGVLLTALVAALAVGAALALCLAFAAGPARADGPEPGCFLRDYSDAHLARHPDQVADRMVMRVAVQSTGTTVADLWVTLANQGHVRRSGRGGHRLWQFLVCWSEGGRALCGVECDGGVMEVTRQDGKGLTFRTDYLLIGPTDQCGGEIDLAEVPGQAVSYRLNRVSGTVCEGEE